MRSLQQSSADEETEPGLRGRVGGYISEGKAEVRRLFGWTA